MCLQYELFDPKSTDQQHRKVPTDSFLMYSYLNHNAKIFDKLKVFCEKVLKLFLFLLETSINCNLKYV